MGPGRTGLVAPDGTGKSTLLRLIAGELRPTRGSVTVSGTLGHLPQTLPLTADLTVSEVLGVAPVLRALDAVESGDVGEKHFAVIGDDWDIEKRTRAQLDRLGLGHLALDRVLGTLSGGRVVSLGLAAQLLRRPHVLILGEPTNNLDLVSVGRPEGALGSYRGAFVAVSHDERFLTETGVARWLRLADGELTETAAPAT